MSQALFIWQEQSVQQLAEEIARLERRRDFLKMQKENTESELIEANKEIAEKVALRNEISALRDILIEQET
jgi:hypothetical protein